MTAYEKICAEACKWCAKSIPVVVDISGSRMHRFEYEDMTGDDDFPCTAPSRDEVIERLTAELAALKLERDELRADKERLEWIFAVLQEHGVDGLSKRLLSIFMTRCIYDRALLDAARAAWQEKADA